MPWSTLRHRPTHSADVSMLCWKEGVLQLEGPHACREASANGVMVSFHTPTADGWSDHSSGGHMMVGTVAGLARKALDRKVFYMKTCYFKFLL